MTNGILAFIVGLSLATAVATAAEKESRAPATVPASIGTVCAQGRNIAEAEEKLNDKLATPSGEVVVSLSKKFGKIKNAKATGMTVTVDNSNSAAPAYIICTSLSGDQG